MHQLLVIGRVTATLEKQTHGFRSKASCTLGGLACCPEDTEEQPFVPQRRLHFRQGPAIPNASAAVRSRIAQNQKVLRCACAKHFLESCFALPLQPDLEVCYLCVSRVARLEDHRQRREQSPRTVPSVHVWSRPRSTCVQPRASVATVAVTCYDALGTSLLDLATVCSL